MHTIIDTNVVSTAHLPALKAAGIETVIRYLSPINPSGEKCIKPAEAHAIAAAGLRLGLVNEGWGDFAHGGISAGAGERDGQWCAGYVEAIGASKGACVYFAIDVDAGAAQIAKLVVPYFQSIRRSFPGQGEYRVGVYGSGAVCAAVMAASLADLAWLSCSTGWSGSQVYLASKKWALRQHLPATIAGIDCDPDDANGDFGDFVPFAGVAV